MDTGKGLRVNHAAGGCVYLNEATFEECDDLVSRPGGVQVAHRKRGVL